jgi:hypothetical protein
LKRAKAEAESAAAAVREKDLMVIASPDNNAPASASERGKLREAQALLEAYQVEFGKLHSALEKLSSGTMRVEIVKSIPVDTQSRQPVIADPRGREDPNAN